MQRIDAGGGRSPKSLFVGFIFHSPRVRLRGRLPAGGYHEREDGSRTVITGRINFLLTKLRMRAEVLNLSTSRRDHQLHELLGDVRLQPFGVSLLEPHDVGDDAAVLAVGMVRSAPCRAAGSNPHAGFGGFWRVPS